MGLESGKSRRKARDLQKELRAWPPGDVSNVIIPEELECVCLHLPVFELPLFAGAVIT